MTVRSLSVPKHEVVFVMFVMEASEGLAMVYGRRGGKLVIATQPELGERLDEALADICHEIRGRGGEAELATISAEDAYTLVSE